MPSVVCRRNWETGTASLSLVALCMNMLHTGFFKLKETLLRRKASQILFTTLIVTFFLRYALSASGTLCSYAG